MNRTWSFVLPATALALASCQSDATPTGQVAATVDGTEITISEVNAELGGVSVPDPEQQQLIANSALDAIISRTIVANEAIERGLDKTPEGAMMLKRAQQLALVELMQRDLAANAPSVSDQEAQRFVADNRSMFAGRTIAVVEQLAVPEIAPELVRQMEPIDTLAGIRQLLDSNGVEYRSSIGTVDSMTLAGDAGRQIAGLAIGDVYVVPQGRGVRVNAIRSREPYPVAGEDAARVAKEMLAGQRVQGQVGAALSQMIELGKQEARYSENFSPPQTPAGVAETPAAVGAPDGEAPAAAQ